MCGRSSEDSQLAQLSLFADADGVDPVPVDDRVRSLRAALPDRIRLGTSSWSFPGWTGLVYAAHNGQPATERVLARRGLSAYARHPLFRTVSLDRTFYAPLTAAEFAHYAAQVPDDFRFVVKAPAAITDPVVRKAGSGEAARDNPSFLDAAAAASAFVQPAVAGLGARAARRTVEPPRRQVLRRCESGLFPVQPHRRRGSAKPNLTRTAGTLRGSGGPRRVHHDQQQGRGLSTAVSGTLGDSDHRRRMN